MEGSRIKNSMRNITAGILNKCVMLLFPFAIRTVILKILGAEYLGLSSLFTSILQVLNMAELGFSSAVVFSMYKPIAENDENTICALMALYKKVYRTIGTIVLGVGLLLLPFLKNLIKGDCPEDINIYVLYIMYLFNTTVSYFLFAYKNCLLTAHQRADITSNVLSVTQCMQYIIQIIVLFAFKNYYVYFIISPVFTIANNVIAAHYANKLYPQYVCRGSIHKEKKNEITKSIGGLMVQKISQVSRNSFDSIFISAFLGLTASAVYGNYYYIMSAIHGVLSVVVPAITASAGNSIVSESVEKNHNDFKKINFIYLWAAGWFTICLACLYQPFMVIWVGDKLLLPIATMVLFCIYFYSNAIGDVISLYIQSAGLWWKVKYVYLLNAVSNIIMNYVLVRLYGVFGIVLATIITGLVFGGFQLCRILYREYFKEYSFAKYLCRILLYFCVTCAVGGLTYAICVFVGEKGLTAFIIRVIICSVLPNIMFFAVYKRTRIFNEAKSIMFNALKRKVKKLS